MKKIVFIMALMVVAANAFGADVCSNQEGSIIYESATTFGSSVVIVRPRLVMAGSQILINANSRFPERDGTAFCKALGMKSGIVTDMDGKDDTHKLTAEFDVRDGSLVRVGTSLDNNGIRIVTCKK
jgi:hypothetical protein